MSKLTDAIISAILKRGVLCEMRNVDTSFDFPQTDTPLGGVDSGGEPGSLTKRDPIKVHLKAEHLTIKIDKGGGNGSLDNETTQ